MPKKTKKPLKKTKKRSVKKIHSFEISWREPIFWRNLVFYFLFFSYIGHFIEMAWTTLVSVVTRSPLPLHILANPLEPYTIYGAGAVLCILVVYPLVKKLDHHIVLTFLIATATCSALELISSIVLTARYGMNPYWDYHARPFNLNGHICLSNCLLFGLLATVFLRVILPPLDGLLRKLPRSVVYLSISVLLALFAAYYFLQG